MTLEEKLDRKNAEIHRLKQDLARTSMLVEYYRQFAPEHGSVFVAPANYFTRQLPDSMWGYGLVVDGRIEIIGRGFDTDEDAVKAAWEHYREILGAQYVT